MTAVEAKEKYLELAKVEELEEKLRSEGYRVERDVPAGNRNVDLIAQRGSVSILYEVVAQHRIRHRRETLMELRKYAKEMGYAFRLVVVHPPSQSVVEIQDLAASLKDYLAENAASYFSSLGQHVVVEDVHSVNLTETRVATSKIEVQGFATVDATIHSGDEDVEFFISAPFSFDACLDHALKLQANPVLDVDLSDWYE